jgi:hypothetical protein
MTIALPDLSSLQVRCDGHFPLTTFLNFTDVDESSPAFRASFCVQAIVDDETAPLSVPLEKILAARDAKRAQFAAALPAGPSSS